MLPSARSSEKFGLVIPTLNEVGNMADPFRTSGDRLGSTTGIDYELLLVVDDNSQDGTADLVKRYAQADPRIRLLTRIGQRGLAGAVIHGWHHTDANRWV